MDLEFKTVNGVAVVKPVSPEATQYLHKYYGAGQAGVAMEERNLMPFSVACMANGLGLQAEDEKKAA